MFFGGHLSTAGGIDKALDRTEEIGGEAVQVFTQSPRMWRPTNHDPATLARFRERREELGLKGVVCHAIYLINLASLDDELYGKSVAALSNTLEVAREIEAEGVVFHVGSHLGAGMDAGLERVVPALAQALELTTERTWLLMENSAGAGGTIGRSIEELALLHAALDHHPRLGVCLDGIELADDHLRLEVSHAHPGLRQGFHADEGPRRWTDGLARLPIDLLYPFPGPLTLTIHRLDAKLRYPRKDIAAPVAKPAASEMMPAMGLTAVGSA